jgi:EmrB/QacA subfamily drug resistance transporter
VAAAGKFGALIRPMSPSTAPALSRIEPPPLAFLTRRAWYPWLVVGVACMGAFMAQLDASIVQLALPFLSNEFQASVNAVSWVAIAYLLALAAFLPVFGRLCAMFGRKLFYVGGFLLFSVATGLCGLADSLTSLVIARVLQGIGGAMLASNSIAIVISAVGPAGRARALGYFAAAQAIGLSVGPPIGGLLLSTWGWRWVFLVTVPVGLAATVIGLLVLPRTTEFADSKTFDWLGALFLMPALVGVVLFLNQMPAWGLTSPAMIATGGLTVTMVALLCWRELRSASPLLDLRIFANPVFSCGIAGVVLSAALLYGIFFIVSFGLVRGYHRPVEMAGLRLAVIPIAIGIVAPLSGMLVDKIQPRLLSAGGMALCVTSLVILAIIATEHQADVVLGAIALALFGVGLGLFITPNNHRTMNAAPSHLSVEASALLNLMRVLGGSLGAAAASSVLTWRIQIATGGQSHWAIFQGRPLLEAVEAGFLMLAVLAAVAGVLAMVREPQR